MSIFDKYLKKKQDYTGKVVGGGSAGAFGGEEEKKKPAYEPVNFDEFLKAPSTEEISKKQDDVLNLEKEYEVTTLGIEVNYGLFKDYTKQLEELEAEMEIAPPEMEFDFTQKRDALVEKHNKVVEALQNDTKKQKEIYEAYTQVRETYDKDVDIYNRWAEAQNKKPPEPQKLEADIGEFYTPEERANQLKAKTYRTGEKENPTWGEQLKNWAVAGLNITQGGFYKGLAMIDEGFALAEDAIGELLVLSPEKVEKFEDKYGFNPYNVAPLSDAYKKVAEDSFKRADEAMEKTETRDKLQKFVGKAVVPAIPVLFNWALTGGVSPIMDGMNTIYGMPWLETLSSLGRMTPFMFRAFGSYAHDLEKKAEVLGEELPYWKHLTASAALGATEGVSELEFFLGMSALTKKPLQKAMERGAKTLWETYAPKAGELAKTLLSEFRQEATMPWIQNPIEKVLGIPADTSIKGMAKESLQQGIDVIPMILLLGGLGGGVTASAEVAAKVKKTLGHIIENKQSLKDGMRQTLEDLGYMEEEPEIETKAYEAKEVPEEGETEVFKGKAYRGESKIAQHGADMIAKMKTAKEKIDYDYGTTANPMFKDAEKVAEKEGIDLSKVAKEDMVWVTKTKKTAEKYGDVSEVAIPKDNIVLVKDTEEGYLVLKNVDKYKTKPKAPKPINVKKVVEDVRTIFEKNKNQGATYNLNEGEIKEGFAVSVNPELETNISGNKVHKRMLEQMELFIESNSEILNQPGKHVGMWYDKETKKTYFDVSTTVKTLKEAVALGQKFNQKAVVNVKTGERINVPKTEVEAPGVLYHGTDQDIKEFTPYEDIPEEYIDVYEKPLGVYVTDKKEFAETIGKNIIEVEKPKKTLDLTKAETFEDFVKLLPIDVEKEKYPLKRMKADSMWHDKIEMQYKLLEDFNDKFQIVDKLKKKGFDSLSFTEEHSGVTATTTVIFDYKNAKIIPKTTVKAPMAKTYQEGVKQTEGKKVNIRINQSKTPKTKGKILTIQFSTDLLQTGKDIGKEFYDKLYSGVRKGYERLADFWEVPPWIAQVTKNFGKNTEVLVVRDIEEAKEFLKNSEYNSVAFSAMDVNKDLIKELIGVIPKNVSVDIGGYIEKPQEFFGKNVNIHKDIKSLVEEQGKRYVPGYDYSLFKDSPVVGRIALSIGCKHHCIFCDVMPHGTTEALSQKEIDQQVDAIVALKSPLIYLDDKTLGQEANYKTLPEIYKKIKEKMPGFDGFIIQTTASEMNKVKFPADYFKKAGIRYVELGVESYNDVIQKVFRKPANIKTIDKAVDWLRQNNVRFIPNVIVGGSWTQKMADDIIKKGVTKEEKKLLNNLEETKESYQRTLDFLEKNKDIISHINLYNFATYADSIIGQEMSEVKDIDLIENVIEKSFHKNPKVHIEAYKNFREFGMKALDNKFIESKSLEEQLKDSTKEINRLKGIIKTIKGNAKKRQEFKKELVKYIKTNMPYAIQNKMLATVKNVSGDKSLEKAMGKIDQYTLEHYGRQYRNAIANELKAKKIKPKITKSGMPKGRFTPIIQDKLDFIRANINGSRAEAQKKIQENITLFNQGKAINIAEENELLNMIGIKEMDLETLQLTLANIKKLKTVGKTLNAIKAEAKKAKHEKDVIDVLESTTGKQVDVDEETGKAVIDDSYRTFPKTKKWGAIRKAIDGIINWQFGWDNLMDKLSFRSKTTKPYASKLSQIADIIHYARSGNIKSLEEILSTIQAKFVQAFEVTSVKQVGKICRDLREEVDLGTFKNSKGQPVHLVLSKEAILKKVMQLDDPSLESTFNDGMYYTEEIENALRDSVSKKEQAWIDGVREVYDYMWERINPIFEEMYGIHFPRNPFYSGTIRRDVDLDTPEASLLAQDAFRFASILNPSLKMRSKSKQSLHYDGITSTLMNYVLQMEHFINWAKPLQEMRSIFSDNRVKSTIKELYGENILNKINGFLDDMTRDGVEKGKIIKQVDTIRFAFTRAILAKPHIGLKQIPSVLAYMTEMPTADFFKGIADFWKNPIKNYRYLVANSAYAKARFGEGFERDIHGAMKSDYVHLLSHTHKILDMTMGLVRAGDKFAVMQGMWAKFYSDTKGQTTSANNAKDAMVRAEIVTQRTQPSFTTESLATGQRGGSLMKLFTMFQNQPNKYFRLIADNARNFRAGRGSRMKAASNIVLAWAILPMLFQFIGDGGKWINRHQLRALILGAGNDILVFGAMIRGMYGWLIKESFDVEVSPVFATMREMEYCLAKVAKWIDPSKDITPEDIQAFTEHFAKAAGQLVGLPTPYGVQVSQAIRDKDPKQLLFSKYIIGLKNEKPKKKKPYKKSYDGDKYSKYLKGKYKSTNKYSKYLKKY